VSARRVSVDVECALADEPGSGHNRWHPDIEAMLTVASGEELIVETRDGLDGQLRRDSTPREVAELSLGRGHPLTGPIEIDGAEPGDLLEVEFLGYETASFGVTAVIPGFGVLADQFPEPYLVKWDITDGVARSTSLLGVSVPADIFAGVVGVSPSVDFMRAQHESERRLADRGYAVAESCAEEAVPASAAEGLRTIPPRVIGGNLDVRRLVRGSRVFLPIQVPGALLSVGDIHFAQGDGESAGTAIEVAGAVMMRCHLHKSPAYLPEAPVFSTPPERRRPYLATTGLLTASDDSRQEMDVLGSARRALLAMVDMLHRKCGLSRQAAYVLCSVAVDLHISELVNVPSPLVSAMLPLDIFETPPRLP